MIGKTLAHYQVTEFIGKGGMGEVYRARDTKLDRDVALKILPSVLGDEPERKARFEREARTLASLQHANIASIYGFEEAEGVRFLVMEMVEGHDLAELIKHGRIPVDQALEIALQMARGIESAHEKGIVHRDLKPANVKVGPSGDVKILDFGLARAYADDPDPSDMENSPTITAAMTRAGIILGTAAYMSPEQARGRAVDKRTDIWSFGVVLYEMLTADRLFAGETISDTIGAILHVDADFDKLPPVPPQVRRLLQRCLERDRRRRLRDIGDAIIELEEAINGDVPEVQAVTVSRSGRPGWIVAAALAVLAGVFGWMALRPSQQTGPKITTLGLPEDTPIDYDAYGNSWLPFDISPDGKQVVYSAGEKGALFLRPVDSFDATELDGTAGPGGLPVFSPDGRWIAYYTPEQLCKVAVSGGAPVELYNTPPGPGLSWRGNDIVFALSLGGGLWQISSDGGEPKPVSTLNSEREETSHRWPHVLPDGRHALITVKTARIESFDDATISLLDLDTGDVRTLIPGGTDARFVEPGSIVYARNGQLFAVRFNPESLSIEGTPHPVLDHVLTVGVNGAAHYAVSANGTLAYTTGEAHMAIQRNDIVRMDMFGRTTPLDLEPGLYNELALSPDGLHLAMSVPRANDKIWVLDMDRRSLSRVTSTPGNDRIALWSPDGSQIAYTNDLSGTSDVYIIPVDGSAPATAVVAGERYDIATSWSPDGRYLAFNRHAGDAGWDIWMLDLQTKKAEPFLATSNSEQFARFSPNGRVVSYVSNASGEQNIYVRPFPGPGTATRISTNEGRRAYWSRDGSKLYYGADIDDERYMMVVAVEWEPTFRAGEPQRLIAVPDDIDGIIPSLNENSFFAEEYATGRGYKHSIRIVFDWAQQLNDAR